MNRNSLIFGFGIVLFTMTLGCKNNIFKKKKDQGGSASQPTQNIQAASPNSETTNQLSRPTRYPYQASIYLEDTVDHQTEGSWPTPSPTPEPFTISGTAPNPGMIDCRIVEGFRNVSDFLEISMHKIYTDNTKDYSMRRAFLRLRLHDFDRSITSRTYTVDSMSSYNNRNVADNQFAFAKDFLENSFMGVSITKGTIFVNNANYDKDGKEINRPFPQCRIRINLTYLKNTSQSDIQRVRGSFTCQNMIKSNYTNFIDYKISRASLSGNFECVLN